MGRIIFNDFSGGLSDSKWRGIEGSFSKLVGIDTHQTPGTITVHQRLDKDSGNTVDALCRVSVSVSATSEQYWFSYTTGKVWRRTSAGVWSLAYTTSPAAGSAGCLGAAVYNGFIYWATQSRLHRIAATVAALADWDANASPNFATFSATDSEFHPMVPNLNGKLWIGDANLIASVDSSATFTASALNLVAPLRVKCLYPFNVDLLIGTIISSTVNICQIVRWDTIQSSWQYAEWLEYNGVNCFLQTTEAVLAQVGQAGHWTYYDGQTLKPYKRIPGTWTPTKYGEVYPGSVGTFLGQPIFGLSNSPDAANSTGNPADQGIYSFGNYSKDYPRVISGPDWIISQDDVTAIEIGAILVERNDLYVAWKEGSNFGVDKLNWSAKYASAYMETKIVNTEPLLQQLTNFARYFADYNSLPSSTAITFKYSKNGAAYSSALTSSTDTEATRVYAEELLQARTLQLRVEFTISANNAPVVEALGIETVDPSK